MTTQELIQTLKARGAKLRAVGRNLICRSVPEDLIAPIKHHRNKLIAWVKRQQQEFLKKTLNTIVLGDCLDVLQKFPDNSVDQMACDPPYSWGFMGKIWDKAVPDIEIWKECLRVLKPGAFAFIMCGPRQDGLEKMIANLRLAGFQISFSPIYWTFATGFPKIHNISKAIEKKYGENVLAFQGAYAGCQLKPAVEVILVATKPLDEKSYTEQALANGKGCTWLDDCRIPYTKESVPSRDLLKQKSITSGQVVASPGEKWQGDPIGRFPANLLVSDNILDDGKNHKGNKTNGWSKLTSGQSGFGLKPLGGKTSAPSDEGSYSRFFSLDAWTEGNLPFLIAPKASKSEKETGLNDFVEETANDGRKTPIDNAYQRGTTPKKNNHPCTKPIKLMSYLISMGSRPGDLILDPFCGSGTTCIAAKLLDRRFIGIEKEEEYHRIAVARVENASLDVPVLKKAVADIKKHEESREQQEDDGPAKAPKPCFFSNMSEEQLKELDEAL
jgi:DNA modification methylase